MELPPELLADVVQYLSRRDLKQLRSTCRRLAEQVVPFLFDSIFLSTDASDLKRAELASISYGRQIRNVVVSFVPYNELTWLSYQKTVRLEKGMRFGRLSYSCRFQQHMAHNYKRFCTARHRAAQPSSASRMYELLEMVLNTGPNIRTVIVTRRQSFNEVDLADYCCWENCPLSLKEHAMFRITPLQGTIGHQSLDLSPLLLTIAKSGVAVIKKLVMDSFQHHGSGGTFRVSHETFGRLERHMSQVSAFLANLVKLRLALQQFRKGQTNPTAPRAIARFLSQAQNLECLYLEAFSYRDEVHPFGRHILQDLGVCRLPKLRVLILRHSEIFGDELLPLLETLPGLKHLVLESCDLKEYFWKDLLEKIKMQHHLETLHLCYIANTAVSSFRYVDYCDEVKRFLVGDGPNPFSVEHLAKFRHKITIDHLDLSFANECYERYF